MKNFNESQVRELVLFTVNDGELYTKCIIPIINNLSKKYFKGTYDHQKSLTMWESLAKDAAKKYSKEFSTGNDGLTMFSVADRKEVAERLADYYQEEIQE